MSNIFSTTKLRFLHFFKDWTKWLEDLPAADMNSWLSKDKSWHSTTRVSTTDQELKFLRFKQFPEDQTEAKGLMELELSCGTQTHSRLKGNSKQAIAWMGLVIHNIISVTVFLRLRVIVIDHWKCRKSNLSSTFNFQLFIILGVQYIETLHRILICTLL